jgi:uncharacterized protein (DUF433 family)
VLDNLLESCKVSLNLDMRDTAPENVKVLPAYRLAEAARYLHANPSTLRAWLHGRKYSVGEEERWSKPVLASQRAEGEPISFLDLVEAHVLLAVRRGYHIPMRNCRKAMEYLREVGGDLHFLAGRGFYHDRSDLFIKLEGKLISLSERGQLVEENIIAEGLKQLDYGDDGYAARFYPRFEERQQKVIVLDPAVNFGRPCLARLGIGADAIAERWRAGEKMTELAKDYGAEDWEIEEAIRWHDRLAA